MSDENIIENRTLVISNFRNLGPFCPGFGKENNEYKEFLKINRSLERDSLGGLVLLIGVNNSGKSNVLDAAEKYKTHKFSDSDYTDFTFTDKVKPDIGLNLANGKYNLNNEKVVIEEPSNPKNVYFGDWTETLTLFLLEEENYKISISTNCVYSDASYYQYAQIISNLIGRMRNSSIYSSDAYILKSIFSNRKDVEKENISIDGKITRGMKHNDYLNKDFESKLVFDSAGIQIFSPIRILSNNEPINLADLTNTAVAQHDKAAEQFYKDIATITESVNVYKDNVSAPKPVKKNLLSDEFVKLYGYRISDNVIKYQRERIKQSDLLCKPSSPNAFFIKVLESIGYSKDALKNAYSGAGTLRDRLESRMNRDLVAISDELNDLLNIDEKKYALSVRLERENMEFFIKYGDAIPLNLDRQSQGFTWLFELFFNLLKSRELSPGDMVLIDEFGDSLGFSTVKELTKKLRDYGQKNGITFILATQNPMAVDITHLDEVRLVVPKDDGSSHIFNQFDDERIQDSHDVVGPVVNGLMVSRNFMRSEDRRTVFVEGAMDYFYLNSFAEQMRREGTKVDIDFIPMNGLGAKGDDEKELLALIKSIERDPIVLVDADIKGKKVKKAAKDMKVTVASLDEVLEGKKEIEDLFSAGDSARLCVAEKSFDRAACISHNFQNVYEGLEDETKDNFRTLIDYVMTV